MMLSETVDVSTRPWASTRRISGLRGFFRYRVASLIAGTRDQSDIPIAARFPGWEYGRLQESKRAGWRSTTSTCCRGPATRMLCPIRTSLLAMALIAFFLGFGTWFKLPLLFPIVMIFLAACCAWRATHASRAGIVLGTLGGETMTVFAYGSHGAPAEREFRINVELALIGAGVLIIAGMIFLVFACQRKPSRWQNVFCCLASFLAPIIWRSVFHSMAREP